MHTHNNHFSVFHPPDSPKSAATFPKKLQGKHEKAARETPYIASKSLPLPYNSRHLPLHVKKKDMNFNEQNAHPRDSFIQFEPEEHVYTVRGTRYQSVTNFLSGFFPQFDTEYWAQRKAAAEHCTPEELIERWKRKGQMAAELGTRLHHNIELYLLGMPCETDGEAFPLFLKFRHDHPALMPFRTEWSIYDEEHRIAGTIDLLEKRDGQYRMYDWKRSSKLIGRRGEVIKECRFGQKAFTPIAHIDNTSYFHYALQQSLYRYILEKHYGITLQSSSLVVLHPTYDDYHLIELPYLRAEVCAMLRVRKEGLERESLKP